MAYVMNDSRKTLSLINRKQHKSLNTFEVVCDLKEKMNIQQQRKVYQKDFHHFHIWFFVAFYMQRMRERRHLLCNSYVMGFHLDERERCSLESI